MPSYRVLFARFPYGGTESYRCTDWLVKTVCEAKSDPRISEVLHMSVNDTPITMSRNRVLKACLDKDVDYVLMIDSDMVPDLYHGRRDAKPFWRTSFEHVIKHKGPCAIAAPYCGPPPHENVYIFRWAKIQSDHPNFDLRLEQFTREEAAIRAGIQEVAALPTGIFLLDLRALKALKPVWFDYEWTDPPFNTEKASTEDVFFTRNLSLAGVPQYCNWDAWAGHLKTKCVGKPDLLTADQVRDSFRDALVRNVNQNEKLIEMTEEGLPPDMSAILPLPNKRPASMMAIPGATAVCRDSVLGKPPYQ